MPLHRRVLAIGDIHGCRRALEVLLRAVKPGPGDLVVTLGDYADRGPDSAGVMEWMLRLKETGRLVALRGNHEQMMLEAREEDGHFRAWLECGGDTALSSYAVLGDEGRVVDVPDEHWDFIENFCVDWYETDTHFFVHAGAYPDLPLNEQPIYILRWEVFNDPPPHENGKIMVCGHTSQKDGRPRNIGHAVCIDTRVYGRNGWLTCLDTTSGQIWQANERGESKTAWIDEFASNG